MSQIGTPSALPLSLKAPIVAQKSTFSVGAQFTSGKTNEKLSMSTKTIGIQ